MKTLGTLLLASLTLLLLQPARTRAQVSTFPYGPYSWTNAARLTDTTGGDGNYCTYTNIERGQVVTDNDEEDDDQDDMYPGPWKKGWRVSKRHGESDSPCARLKSLHKAGTEAYLDLKINTSQITFMGSERYEFLVALRELSEPGVGTLRIQENSGGGFVDLPDYPQKDLSTFPSGFSLQSGTLPISMGRRSSVTIRIVITCLQKKTPHIYVDNNCINGGSLPVQLTSFSVKIAGVGRIELSWSTASEVNNYGFYVQRRSHGQQDFTDLRDAFVPGHGTTLTPQRYTYIDTSIMEGTWEYRLRQLDLDGLVHYTEPIQVNLATSVRDGIVGRFELQQNYPNPFNPETAIQFSVEQAGPATLRIYNALGQEVVTLFDEAAVAGNRYRARLYGAHLASGLYYYRLESNGKSEVKKMTLLK